MSTATTTGTASAPAARAISTMFSIPFPQFEPIASASIGQVHEAVASDGRQLALKVQYPGVGDAIVRAPVAGYGSAEASGGVGGASIDVDGEITTGKGFVGQTNTWRGDGPDTIELGVGVGDARVVLE